MKKFLKELQRRNVIKAAISYVVIGWATIQVCDILLPAFNFPDTAIRYILYILIAAFPFWLVFAYVFEWSPSGFKRTSAVAEEQSVHVQTSQRLTYFIIGGITFVIVLFIADMVFNLTDISETPNSEKSILVLPFDNNTNSETVGYFVAGMHDALTTELGRIGAFRVLSQSTAKAYKEMGVPLSKIAEEQGVDYVVEGSVMCLGESMCFQPKLISVKGEEKQIWAGNYTNDVSEVLNMYNQVTKQISAEINVVLTPEETDKLELSKTVDPEAYRLYLQGRHLSREANHEGHLDRSIEIYQEALRLDPDFALAFVGVAISYTTYGWNLYKPKTDIIPPAKKFALKALEIDNTLGEAYAELAFIHMLDWNWSESEKMFIRALELSPNDSRTHYLYSLLLTYTTRHDEAIEECKIAHNLDPLNVEYWTQIGRHHYFARDYDGALEVYDKILDVFPQSSLKWYVQSEVAKALAMKGMYREAIEEYLKADFNITFHMHLGYIYGLAGEKDKALEILNEYQEFSKERFIPRDHIGLIYIGLGEMDKAFEYFLNNNDDRSGHMLHLKVDPMMDPIRSDPRFQQLLDKVNFPN